MVPGSDHIVENPNISVSIHIDWGKIVTTIVDGDETTVTHDPPNTLEFGKTTVNAKLGLFEGGDDLFLDIVGGGFKIIKLKTFCFDTPPKKGKYETYEGICKKTEPLYQPK